MPGRGVRVSRWQAERLTPIDQEASDMETYAEMSKRIGTYAQACELGETFRAVSYTHLTLPTSDLV